MRSTRVLRFAALALSAGATATVVIAGMGSWDASNPFPDYAMRGTIRVEGSPEHPALWGWRAITPDSWQLASWIYKHPSRSVEGQFFVGNTIVDWKFGRGLFDEVFVERLSGVEFSADVAQQRSWLDHDTLAHEFPAPSWLEAPAGVLAFGTPIPEVLGTSWWLHTIKVPTGEVILLWDGRFTHERIEVPVEGQPGRMMIQYGDLLPQTPYEASLTEDNIANASEIQQFRAFGWPLRSVVLHGVLRTVRWPEPPEGRYRERVEYWNDGLGYWDVGYRTSVQESPATGIAWKPIWPMFLANSVILGLPLVAVGWCVGWAWRAARRAIRPA